MAPPGKPKRTYPFGVKITRGVESANLSTEMQFQVNRTIFVREMNHYVFACYVMFSFATSGIIAKFECFERTWQWQWQ